MKVSSCGAMHAKEHELRAFNICENHHIIEGGFNKEFAATTVFVESKLKCQLLKEESNKDQQLQARPLIFHECFV